MTVPSRFSLSAVAEDLVPAEPVLVAKPVSFNELYETQFDFVWRNLRRLGIEEASLRDVAQDVFVVIHRRLPDFEGRAPLRSWVYSIVTRVARQHRRGRRRKDLGDVTDAHELPDSVAPNPQQRAEQNEDFCLLLELLSRLDDEKREAFILSDLEEMTVPEIAAALAVNQNTVYSRVRAARTLLRLELAARAARDGGSR
jgi:RNA polymerase sigma-70 factor (ECF subfamily)